MSDDSCKTCINYKKPDRCKLKSHYPDEVFGGDVLCGVKVVREGLRSKFVKCTEYVRKEGKK